MGKEIHYIQSVLVDKHYYNEQEAIRLVKTYYKFKKIDEGKPNYFRFRQAPVRHNYKFYIKEVPFLGGVKEVIGYLPSNTI